MVMTGAPESVIRTPDQRLRVFVSSTLRELAAERAAARAAIERLRLAPVMFELGARPHPPRELYRAYLAQSDVFVGIYADSYGWVAPDEEVSGLEDEYNLAPAEMPKLIYIKTSEHRDDRLEELIARIRTDDTAAYLPFEDADELGQRIAGDLASLLAERFDETRDDTRSVPSEDRERGRCATARPLHEHDRPRRRPRAPARHPRPGIGPGRESDRPRRNRQEPARDRGGARDRGPVPRRHLLRAAGGGARARTAAADDRVFARHPRQRRSGVSKSASRARSTGSRC